MRVSLRAELHGNAPEPPRTPFRNASWGEGQVSCYYFGSQLNGVGGGFFYHREMSALTRHFTGWAFFSATGFLS